MRATVIVLAMLVVGLSFAPLAAAWDGPLAGDTAVFCWAFRNTEGPEDGCLMGSGQVCYEDAEGEPTERCHYGLP